jgi:hypothetical protein
MTILFENRIRASMRGPRNHRSLGFARDDKGENNGEERVVAEGEGDC